MNSMSVIEYSKQQSLQTHTNESQNTDNTVATLEADSTVVLMRGKPTSQNMTEGGN